jgi:succinate dehydrogenase / fumarate reductase, cytochrome b subunit
MQKALTFVDTTIGKKTIMAVTGLVWFGFVVGHMLGNLQVYLGPEKLNAYAKSLKDLGPLLWAARLTLLGAIGLHIWAALSLVTASGAARPVGYRVKRNVATNYAAITMKLSGPILLLFMLYHLAHFTVPGIAMTSGYEHSHTDVYNNVVRGFSVPWVAALYVLAQLALGLHLYHGSWSLLQTLGLSHPRYNAQRKLISQGLAAVVIIGNLSFPIAVQAGVITTRPAAADGRAFTEVAP